MTRPPPRRLTAARLAAWAWQGLVLAGLAAVLIWAARNSAANLRASGLASGFDFLGRAAGFDIAESAIAYSPRDTNAKVFWVGLVNTLRVSALGAFLATALGVGFGVALRAKAGAPRAIARGYVELARNIPLPILLLVLYSLLAMAPPPRAAIDLFGLGYVSNRGLYLPRLDWRWGEGAALLGALLALAALAAIWRWAASRRAALVLTLGWLGFCGLALVLSLSGLERPRPQGFGFVGGSVLSPPLLSLVAALGLYSGGYIAEVVRAALGAVAPGQTEAAQALGLSPAQTLRWVTLPQALRVAAPPLASQYLNLVKNASLAIVVGYPDLVALFGGTVLNQTGQAIETLGLILAFYLVVSLTISGLINLWAARQARWAVR
jgi:general L-amino acid transport system permease protein